ncbi:four helix bundle protein [Ekhidna sp.]|jgi:four helix bundle protein|uniref:four helix bundle protein n=1 Tax=Ekhidna sp. TaxID=2608089 RepID=UPI0032F05824
MHNFKELQVWQKGIDIAQNIYELTSTFPSEEKFGIVSQMRRSSVSVPSNVAEGAGRKTDKDFSNFLSMSLGSQFELETQLIISNRVGFISDEQLTKESLELVELQKMTRSLVDKFSRV